MGFVKIMTLSFSIVEFFQTNFGSHKPFTDNPNFGSLSSIECPPKIGTPASSALSEAPINSYLKISIDNV